MLSDSLHVSSGCWCAVGVGWEDQDRAWSWRPVGWPVSSAAIPDASRSTAASSNAAQSRRSKQRLHLLPGWRRGSRPCRSCQKDTCRRGPRSSTTCEVKLRYGQAAVKMWQLWDKGSCPRGMSGRPSE